MIDVSAYQGKIDWARVYQAGVRRAYIKWGQLYTHGYSVDPFALRNVEEARKHGVEIGLYWFATPTRSPLEERAFFLNNAAAHLLPGDLPPALDLEVTGGHTWEYLNEWKATWFAEVDKEVGVKAIFYSYLTFWQHMTLYPDRPVWGADPRPGFMPPPSWAIHQLSSTGRVDGISGPVDEDRVIWEPTRIARAVGT